MSERLSVDVCSGLSIGSLLLLQWFEHWFERCTDRRGFLSTIERVIIRSSGQKMTVLVPGRSNYGFLIKNMTVFLQNTVSTYAIFGAKFDLSE